MSDKHTNEPDVLIEKHPHHILPVKTAVAVGVSLLILTVVTVAVAQVDLGKWNFVVAMAIAVVKALLVMLFFMNLLYDSRENGVIFATSFLFLAIFIVLTSTDLFFRGDVYVKPGTALVAAAPAGASQIKKPWIATPALVAHGKELFAGYCVTCHGAEGLGNGIASSGLNPKPRNFTQDKGWKNGRKPSQVFKTLKEGIAGGAMASWSSIPVDDRWALVSYVLSLGPPHEADTVADLAKVGVDANQETSGVQVVAPSISVDLAMTRMAMADPVINGPETDEQKAHAMSAGAGGRAYEMNCAGCHGANGRGGVRVRNLGVNPPAYIVTQPFTANALGSSEFDQIVMHGLPGNVMPGFGQLTSSEVSEIQQYIKTVAGR